MAASQHTPTKAQAEIIHKMLCKVADGKPQFIAKDKYLQWFGRTDKAAREHLLDMWDAARVEHSTLYYIEVTEGYVLVCGEHQNDWLIEVKAEYESAE